MPPYSNKGSQGEATSILTQGDSERKIQGTLHPNPNGFWTRKAIVLSIEEAAKA